MNPQEKLQMINGLLREVETEENTTLPIACALGSANSGGKISFALNGRVDLQESAVIGEFNEEEPESVKDAVRTAYKEMLQKLSDSLAKVGETSSEPESTEEETDSSEEEDGNTEA